MGSVATTDGADQASAQHLTVTDSEVGQTVNVAAAEADRSPSAAAVPLVVRSPHAGSGLPQELASSLRTAVADLVAAPTAIADALVAAVAGLLGNSSAAYGPTAPTEPPTVWVLFAWVRRQIQNTFFNQAPTAAPAVYLEETERGVIAGTLGAKDAEGDPLTYTVVDQPAHGQVVINPDGTYQYTPDPAFALSGGSDTFTVKIADTGFHLNLLNLFTGGDNTTTVPVSLTVKPIDPSPPGDTSQGYDVYNLSSKPITFANYVTEDHADAGPPVGTVVPPGGSVHFEVVYTFLESRQIVVEFDNTDTKVPVSFISLDMSILNDPSVTCGAVSGACSAIGNKAVGVLDKAGTTFTVGPDNPQEQARLLDLLCVDGAQGSCGFTPTRQEELWNNPQELASYKNPYGAPTNKFTYKDTVTTGYSDNVQVSAKVSARLGPIVNAELSATYGHTWTHTESKEIDVEVNVPAGEIGTLYAETPIYRDYGDVTLQLGNTTWYLKGMYFDSPRPTGAIRHEVTYTPLPPPSRALAAAGQGGGHTPVLPSVMAEWFLPSLGSESSTAQPGRPRPSPL